MTKKPYIAIILSFPAGFGLMVLLSKFGVFESLEDSYYYGNMSEITYVVLHWLCYVFTFGLPIVTFIVYGIHQIIHTKDTIPREKEKMPWNYRGKK